MLLPALTFSGAVAAPPVSDFDILAATVIIDDAPRGPKHSFMESVPDGSAGGQGILPLAFSGLMYIYQSWISPQLPSACLYEYSCSGYSKRLISEYGLAKGIVSTADRLMRCNRVAATDIHPLWVNESTGLVKESVGIYKIRAE